MEAMFKALAGAVALGVEASAAVLIAIGAVEALYNTARRLAPGLKGVIHKKEGHRRGPWGVIRVLGFSGSQVLRFARLRFWRRERQNRNPRTREPANPLLLPFHGASTTYRGGRVRSVGGSARFLRELSVCYLEFAPADGAESAYSQQGAGA